MRISDWSQTCALPISFVSDSFTDTAGTALASHTGETGASWTQHPSFAAGMTITDANRCRPSSSGSIIAYYASGVPAGADYEVSVLIDRSEEHTSELQSLMHTSYAGFCLEKKKQ